MANYIQATEELNSDNHLRSKNVNILVNEIYIVRYIVQDENGIFHKISLNEENNRFSGLSKITNSTTCCYRDNKFYTIILDNPSFDYWIGDTISAKLFSESTSVPKNLLVIAKSVEIFNIEKQKHKYNYQTRNFEASDKKYLKQIYVVSCAWLLA